MIEKVYISALDKIIENFNEHAKKIDISKPSKDLIKNIKVNYNGHNVNLEQIANISVQSNTISVDAFDKSSEKAIIYSLSKEQLDCRHTDSIYVIFPAPSAERRQEISKKLKLEFEQYKISLQNERRKFLTQAKELVNLSEKYKNIDIADKIYHKKLQEMHNILEQRTKKILCP